MKKASYIFLLLAIMSGKSIAQKNTKLAEVILADQGYNIDLPTYEKAKLIVATLLAATTLKEAEIVTALDAMLNDPRPIENQILTNYFGLPLFIDTGNPTRDNKIYKAEKDKWIKNNPKKYKQLIDSKKSKPKSP